MDGTGKQTLLRELVSESILRWTWWASLVLFGTKSRRMFYLGQTVNKRQQSKTIRVEGNTKIDIWFWHQTDTWVLKTLCSDFPALASLGKNSNVALKHCIKLGKTPLGKNIIVKMALLSLILVIKFCSLILGEMMSFNFFFMNNAICEPINMEKDDINTCLLCPYGYWGWSSTPQSTPHFLDSGRYFQDGWSSSWPPRIRWGGGGEVYDYSWQVWGNTCTKLELAGVGEEKGKRGRGKWDGQGL